MIITSFLFQGCGPFSISHPIRRMNSSTFIDDNIIEVSYSGELSSAYEIDELGGYSGDAGIFDIISNTEVGYKFYKDLKLMADFTTYSNGNIFMSGIEKSFPLDDNLYYAVTAQSQYSTASGTDNSDNGLDEVTIDSEITSFALINEVVLQGNSKSNFRVNEFGFKSNTKAAIRAGIYLDYVKNEVDIIRTNIDSTQITSRSSASMEDFVIGIPIKVSLRFWDFEIFGGLMPILHSKNDYLNNDEGSTTFSLGMKYSF
jgi:hypothetical protein